MNPWWWLESSPDILMGLETLQYKHQLSPAEAEAEGDKVMPSAEVKNNKVHQATASAENKARQEAKQRRRAAKASAVVNEHQDFIRENNMVVQCMGR